MNFANIFCWQDSYHTQIAHWHGWLLIRFTIDNHRAYMQPIGSGDIAEVIDALAADARSAGEPLRLFGLSDKWAQTLESLYPEKFAFHASADNADYIYLAENLATLPGRQYQPKRNFINRFTSRYNYRFEPISADNLEDALYLNHCWREQKGAKLSDPEQLALRRAFDHFAELNLRGWILYASAHPVAFAIGSKINHDTFCIHIEKTNVEFDGAGAMINNLTAVELYQEYKYINREDDLGLEGLRRAKQSYYPVELLTKHSALMLTAEQIEMRQLWQRVFGDDRKTIDHFFTNLFDPELCFTYSADNHIVAMLHIVPLISPQHRTAYIYAVATDPAYRNQGIASSLVRAALQKIEASGYTSTTLIPADLYAIKFYERFGFECTGNLFDFSEFNIDYDLGTGTPERDFAMVKKFY